MENAERLRNKLIEREKEAKDKAKELYLINKTANAEQLAKNVATLISISLRSGLSTVAGTANLHAAFELYELIDPADIPDAAKFDALKNRVRGLHVADKIIEKGKSAECLLASKTLGETAISLLSGSAFEPDANNDRKLSEDALVGRKLAAMLRTDDPDALLRSLSDSAKESNGIEKICESIASTLKVNELGKKPTAQIVSELENPRVLDNYAVKMGFEIIEKADIPDEAAEENKPSPSKPFVKL